MTCPSCDSSAFLNLTCSSYFEGGLMPLPTALRPNHILERCIRLSDGTLYPPPPSEGWGGCISLSRLWVYSTGP